MTRSLIQRPTAGASSRTYWARLAAAGAGSPAVPDLG
jgi:hypothetical protein